MFIKLSFPKKQTTTNLNTYSSYFPPSKGQQKNKKQAKKTTSKLLTEQIFFNVLFQLSYMTTFSLKLPSVTQLKVLNESLQFHCNNRQIWCYQKLVLLIVVKRKHSFVLDLGTKNSSVHMLEPFHMYKIFFFLTLK